MASKRKHAVLTGKEGPSHHRCSKVLVFPSPQLVIFGREKKLKHTLVLISSNPSYAKKCCILWDAFFQKLDEAYFIWFQQQSGKEAPVSGNIF